MTQEVTQEDILYQDSDVCILKPDVKKGILIFSILNDAVPETATEPKMAKLNNKGPMVVPTLFTPPARLKRCDPVFESPMVIASGLAAVCCKEKPNATINKPEIIKGNDTLSAAGINNSVPHAEMTSPSAIPFLYPIRFKIS